MSNPDREYYLDTIERLERALKGETIDGVKMGDSGISHGWLKRTLQSYRDMLQKIEEQREH
jgi:hypothetical protein